jgi:CubicO group peptidase (beta-lactamase class C family)
MRVAAAVVMVPVVVIGLGRLYFNELISGPDLVPTPSEISLKSEFPPPSGWSEDRVADALDYADGLASSSVIVLHRGGVIAEWGETNRKISVHSVRKSMVSALYGIAAERGLLDIHATLAELGIDDQNPALSEIERSATLRDLLTARSGIYHPSVKDDNGPYPAPGTHRPDEAFVYNNWSFNAVGGIFEQLTGLTLGDALRDWIAQPIGMQDFEPNDVRYTEGEESIFPAFRFWMTARDLARFGQLYVDGGSWKGVQVVPEAWIQESWTNWSEGARAGDEGYGYMWWTMPDGSFMATGTGGQKIRIYPEDELVIVNRVDTSEGLGRAIWWFWGGRVNNSAISELRRRLATALPELVGGSP